MKFLRRLTLCRIPWPFFFHRIEVIETYDKANYKMQCVDCERYFAVSARYMMALPWDDEFEILTREMYGLPRTKK